MSATLTWASSGNGAKTGTTIATYLDDLDTLITSKSGDATFFWEKAGKNSATTPYYLLLRPKSGAAGRIAIIHWSSSPAANNAAILDTTPATTSVFLVWFPNGTGTTLSNLTAASGTICGTDTNCTKVGFMGSLTTLYTTSFVHYYFDSAEAMWFATGNPATGTSNTFNGAGMILVDASDNEYGGVFASTGATSSSFGSTTGMAPWNISSLLAGASTAAGHIRTNYGSTDRLYFQGYLPSGAWANQAVGPLDILTNTAVTQVWFPQVPLIGRTKGEGFVLKLRQVAWGPGTLGALSVYNTTGPVVAARQSSNATAGVTGAPWLVNFKI
jgi:hypothetical protein